MDWNKFISILNTASAFVIAVAAVYLARFEYRLIEKLKKQFLPLPFEVLDYPFTRREASGLKDDIEEIQRVDRDQWTEINRIREACDARSHGRRPQ